LKIQLAIITKNRVCICSTVDTSEGAANPMTFYRSTLLQINQLNQLSFRYHKWKIRSYSYLTIINLGLLLRNCACLSSY